jgi:hypothetical protein
VEFTREFLELAGFPQEPGTIAQMFQRHHARRRSKPPTTEKSGL